MAAEQAGNIIKPAATMVAFAIIDGAGVTVLSQRGLASGINLARTGAGIYVVTLAKEIANADMLLVVTPNTNADVRMQSEPAAALNQVDVTAFNAAGAGVDVTFTLMVFRAES